MLYNFMNYRSKFTLIYTKLLLFPLIIFITSSARADLVSKSYVDSAVASITWALNAKENLSSKLKSAAGSGAAPDCTEWHQPL
jgi:hypothetical protein